MYTDTLPNVNVQILRPTRSGKLSHVKQIHIIKGYTLSPAQCKV